MMKTLFEVTYDDKYYQDQLELSGDARCEDSRLHTKTISKPDGTPSTRSILVKPASVRQLRKALQAREQELVDRGFLDAE